jgi:hypothetical protein
MLFLTAQDASPIIHSRNRVFVTSVCSCPGLLAYGGDEDGLIELIYDREIAPEGNLPLMQKGPSLFLQMG